MSNLVGFMQGRLSPIINGKIQSFPWQNWKNEFLLAKNININLIEWTLDHDNLYENPIMSSKGHELITELKNKYSIIIETLTGDCFMQEPFWKNEGNKKKKLKEDFINILQACSKIDIKIMVIPLVDGGSIGNQIEEDELSNFLITNTPLIKSLRLKIAFEMDKKPAEVLRFINKFDPTIFGINYDMGNSASLDYNPDIEFSNYGFRILNVHVKDRLINGSTIALGDGNVDFKKIFSLLKKFKYEGNYILQAARAKDEDHKKIIIDGINLIKKLEQEI